jgi:hypothetical protein
VLISHMNMVGKTLSAKDLSIATKFLNATTATNTSIAFFFFFFFFRTNILMWYKDKKKKNVYFILFFIGFTFEKTFYTKHLFILRNLNIFYLKKKKNTK